MNHNTIILHLSLINGIGPATINSLISKKGIDDLAALYAYSIHQYVHLFGFTEKVAHALVDGLRNTRILEQELALIRDHGVRWVTLLDEQYPVLLKNTYLCPPVLYWWGNDLAIIENSIAIVGARKATHYAQVAIKQMVAPLVQMRCSIVSGGAIGADTMAHTAALESGGNTVVVLGSGLLKPYPYENRTLFDACRVNGSIVLSIFPLTMQALPGNFPARNRVIAGLAKGCLVVQASKKSGSLITAEYALQYGREVFAMPGPFHDALSQGCHDLIRQGAHLVYEPQHILDEFGYGGSYTRLALHMEQTSHFDNVLGQPDSSFDQEKSIQPRLFNERILYICKVPKTLDELLLLFPGEREHMQTVLCDLHLSGFIDQDFAGRWYTI